MPGEMPWLVSPQGVRATPRPALEPMSCTAWMAARSDIGGQETDENNGLAACDPIGYVGQQKLPPKNYLKL